MTPSMIVAMTKTRVIGKNNQLPWHISDDLKRFKKITMGHPLIMGRKTFESIGKPLPGRQNIVLTQQADYKKDGITVAHNLCEALAVAEQDKEPFVIGGSKLFEAALPMIGKLYLTLVHKDYDGDTYFPEFDLKKDFQILEEEKHPDFTFITAERKS